MFNSIIGIINAKGAETAFLLSGFIEWEITMPVNDIQLLSLNNEHKIYTWIYHREDQMKLFGFINERRRMTFLELLKVEGIGPKGAVKIMGGINQEDFEKALEESDISRLEAVPGLGKKTAQKMVLSLKGKLVQSGGNNLLSTPYNDLVEALTAMGYERRTAVEALAKAQSSASDIPEEEKEKFLFKEAIVFLSSAQ
jgi:Holliday junction DNA helicase RuvA